MICYNRLNWNSPGERVGIALQQQHVSQNKIKTFERGTFMFVRLSSFFLCSIYINEFTHFHDKIPNEIDQ